MANDAHLKALLEGMEYWNRWREANGHIMPDLLGVDLSGMDLRKADFRNADLNGADLRLAELEGADFSLATWIDGRRCPQGSIGGCNDG